MEGICIMAWEVSIQMERGAWIREDFRSATVVRHSQRLLCGRGTRRRSRADTGLLALLAARGNGGYELPCSLRQPPARLLAITALKRLTSARSLMASPWRTWIARAVRLPCPWLMMPSGSGAIGS